MWYNTNHIKTLFLVKTEKRSHNMAKSRKDNKGRVLRQGESQRKNLTYQYRYTLYGNRHVVYANSLDELRRKEVDINKKISMNQIPMSQSLNVIELIDLYIKSRNISIGTKEEYTSVKEQIKKTYFGKFKVQDVRVADAKQFFLYLQKEKGLKFGTIKGVYRGLLKASFKKAYDDDIIIKNPFDIKLDFLKNDTKKRKSLNKEQTEQFMQFIKNDKVFNNHYDEFNILLETGVRESELVGITISDIDLKEKYVSIDKQLRQDRNGNKYICPPKTVSGIRKIPLTQSAIDSFRNIIERFKARSHDTILDGYTGFVFLNSNDDVKTGRGVYDNVKRAYKKYTKVMTIKTPPITPHIFRHTFCTNMHHLGMDDKTLQYIMGHSSVSTTMNIYTDVEFDYAQNVMESILS